MENRGVLTKRIPTILGVLILLGGLVAGIFLVSQQQGLGAKAGPTSVPKNLKLANRGSNGVAITWTTDVPVTGLVKYSDDPTKLNLPAGDTRDQISGSATAYTTHYAEITGLSPDKTYYFEIGSGSQNYNDNGKPYQVRTAPAATAPAEDVASGKIISNSGAGVAGAIVYLEINGAETLSALTRNDGSWRAAISNFRDRNGRFLSYDKARELISITVQAGASGTATAITNTATDNPVPEITLGKTHNFAGEDAAALLSVGGQGTDSGSLRSGNFNLNQAESATSSVRILNPSEEGEKISVANPEFIGTGPSGLLIKLSLNTIPTSTGIATPSANGSWTWTAPVRLDPGFYTLSLEYSDSQGSVQRLSRGFEIVSASATGGLPSFTATVSATPTLASLPEATETGQTRMPATSSGRLQEAGVLTPTYALLIVGIGLFAFGVFWKRSLKSTS